MSELDTARKHFNRLVNKTSGRKVKELSECWLWEGTPSTFGYGTYQTNFAKARGITYAHQASYYLFKDQTYKPSREMQCSHQCESKDVGSHRMCVNPEHITLETRQENIKKRDENLGSYQTIKTGGVNSGSALFTEAQLNEIKVLRESGMFYKTIAERFSCNRRTIERIFTGVHYKV